MTSRRSRPRAFTLIELLVVIAVIMLLAAMAMPAMNRVSRLARRVGCISNMHQMYVTFASYSNSYDNLLPRSVMEYYKMWGMYDNVPAFRPFVPDPRILYCTLKNVGVLPNIDGPGSNGDYCGWNLYGNPNCYHVLSNIAMFFNIYAIGQFGSYGQDQWALGTRWRHPRAAMIAHRRVMRYNIMSWDPNTWQCQNWYPHGNYHDMIYGDGRNETHNAAEWMAKPKLWFDWGGSDRHNVYY